MNEEQNMPFLTLEPEPEEKKEPEAVPVPPAPSPSVKEPNLTPEEQKMVDDFAAKIDLDNSSQILRYGAGAQKKMADFSETALENVRTKDLGEIGDMLSGVVVELRGLL